MTSNYQIGESMEKYRKTCVLPVPVRRNRDMLRSLMTDISQARNVLVNSPQSVSGYVRALCRPM